MTDGGRGDAQCAATQTAETVARQRQHETLRGAAAVFRHRPSTHFCVTETLALGARQLRLDTLPKLVTPLGHTDQWAETHAQIFHTDRIVVLEIPDARGHAL